MGPEIISNMSQRLNAVKDALTAAMPSRVVTRELKHFDDHSAADIAAGVLMVTSRSERDYSPSLGMVAKEGTQKLLLIGQIKLAESVTGEALEDAEITFIEELKAALRITIPGIGIRLTSVEHSGQIDKPYGWLVASVDAGPPQLNTI